MTTTVASHQIVTNQGTTGEDIMSRQGGHRDDAQKSLMLQINQKHFRAAQRQALLNQNQILSIKRSRFFARK